MQLTTARALMACVAMSLAACAPAAPQRCQRYDVASLVPENGFAATVPWDSPLAIDSGADHVEVAIFLMRPIRAAIDLVHVVGDREVDHWSLQIPDKGQNNAICWIAPRDGVSNCGAIIDDVPELLGGYYFLRPNGNTVLEAGLAFSLCK